MEFLFFDSIWQKEYLGNALWEYVIFLSFFLLLTLGFFVLKYFLFRKISQRIKEQKILKLLLGIVDEIRSPFYIFISFYIALSVIEIPALLTKLFGLVLMFWIVYRAVFIGYQFIDFFLDGYIKKRAETGNKAMIRAVGNIAKGILWVVAGLIVLSLLGVNVTGLVAGMGLGGVAIAFALQGILSDLFSSFSIYFDKPFVEGDFIVVGDKWGTVEKIGIKSTRIRALHGEEIVFSNRELTSAQVHNMRKMERRRVNFKLGVIYETPTKKMEKIPDIIKKNIAKEELAELDRVHFSAFNDFSLDYDVVFFVNSPEYKVFMEVNERILLDIKRDFEKEEIGFAYPTKTIYLRPEA